MIRHSTRKPKKKVRLLVPTFAVAGLVGLSLLAPIAANAETVGSNNVRDEAGNHITYGRFIAGSPAETAPAGNFTSVPAGAMIGTAQAWTVVGNSVDLNSNSYIPPPVGDASVTQTIDLTGDDANTAHTDGIQQTISTTVGQSYTVGFVLANNPYGPPASNTTMTVSATGGTTQSYTGPASSSSTSAAAMNWQVENYTFTATVSVTTITFTSTTSTATGSYGPVVTDIATGITEIEVGIPTIPAGGTGTLNLEMIGPSSGWTSDTNLADSNASSQATFASDGGNTLVSPTEVTGGPFPTAQGTLAYLVKVPADATPGSTIIATVPSTFTDSAGDVASIHVRIKVAPDSGTPLADWKIAGAGALLAVLLGTGWYLRRRRLATTRL